MITLNTIEHQMITNCVKSRDASTFDFRGLWTKYQNRYERMNDLSNDLAPIIRQIKGEVEYDSWIDVLNNS